MPTGIADLTEGSGAATPTRKPTTKKTRKDTILSLVEALLQDGANSDSGAWRASPRGTYI